MTAPYCETTAMFPELLVTVPKVICTGTALPGVTVAGTVTFTCHNPTKPGDSPEKARVAVCPPMVTVGFTGVKASGGVVGAPAPVAGAFVTVPCPVANIWITSPGFTGLSGVICEKSAFRIAPTDCPLIVAVKIPGADGVSDILIGALAMVPFITITGVVVCPASSNGT